MSAPGESLGGRLKAERERKGFSTQKAADQLHLDAWVIEALESGDYARIGPAVYGKGHLKRYAGLLGLPADEIIGAYETRPAAPVEAVQAPALRMRAAETQDRAPPWSTVAGVAVISVLVAAAAALWWRPWHAKRSAAAQGPASAVHANPGIGPPLPAAGDSADGGPADGRPGDRVGGSESSRTRGKAARSVVTKSGDRRPVR